MTGVAWGSPLRADRPAPTWLPETEAGPYLASTALWSRSGLAGRLASPLHREGTVHGPLGKATQLTSGQTDMYVDMWTRRQLGECNRPGTRATFTSDPTAWHAGFSEHHEISARRSAMATERSAHVHPACRAPGPLTARPARPPPR